jgi:pimeloyl-ACP methyl ester carboxylesterase
MPRRLRAAEAPGPFVAGGRCREARVRVEVEDGIELAVEVRGRGPALVCIHGFGGAKEDFDDHVDRLASRATVVALDLRGHGDSSHPPDPAAYSLDRLAVDVVEVADALGLARFRLLGHSMGGMVARRVALGMPNRVEALVLMSTAAGPPRGLDPELVDLAAQLALEDFGALGQLLDAARPLGTPAYERLLAERPGFRDFGKWKWSRTAPAMWSALAPQIAREPDARDTLRAVTCPTLVMIGALDAAFYEGALEMAAALPAASLAIIPEAGHHPQFENPVAWGDALGSFLDFLDSPDALDRCETRDTGAG